MDKRTAGIVATVVTTVLCACPGLFAICFGAVAIPVSFVPGAQIDIAGRNDPQAAFTAGIVGLCLGLIFIAIPIAVGYFTLRNRPAASEVISAPSYSPTTPPPSKPVEPQPPESDETPPSDSDEPSPSDSDEQIPPAI
jgi:hypothetical protein